MTAKTKNPVSSKISDPLKAIEDKIRIYIWKIYGLQQIQAELEQVVSELQNENFQLKKEMEKFTGTRGQ